MTRVLVAPSLLAADPLRLGEEVASVERAGCDWHHVDVMDGHYVPNLTFGLPLVAALKRVAKVPLDVHIMVSNPDAVALDYVNAGADSLTFHVEAAVHHHRLLQTIRDGGARAGVALNPGTPVEAIVPLLDDLDLVLVMSVNPGFGGQRYLPQAAARVAQVRAALAARGREKEVVIEVDGGITDRTAPDVVRAGATMLVAGTYVYGAEDRRVPIAKLQGLGTP
jgi:ribulose-phosphate 3-epimerase